MIGGMAKSNRPLLVRAAARITGLSPRRVREICEEHNIGELAIGEHTRVLREADIPRIERHRRPVGRPKSNNGKD